MFENVIGDFSVTLTRVMDEVARNNPEQWELTCLFNTIATCCKAMSNTAKRSELLKSDTLGYQASTPVYRTGETLCHQTQYKLPSSARCI